MGDVGDGLVLGLGDGPFEAALVEVGVAVVEFLEGFEFAHGEGGESAFLAHEAGQGLGEFGEGPRAPERGLAVIDAAGLGGQLFVVRVDQEIEVVVRGLSRRAAGARLLALFPLVQRALAEGMALREAILLAVRRRLRAVILTATTTVVGLLPTAYGWGGSDPFVMPMALALSWGLMFA